jgi:hypothetical protein
MSEPTPPPNGNPDPKPEPFKKPKNSSELVSEQSEIKREVSAILKKHNDDLETIKRAIENLQAPSPHATPTEQKTPLTFRGVLQEMGILEPDVAKEGK